MRLILSTRRRHVDLEWSRRADTVELDASTDEDPADPLPVGFTPNPTPGDR